MFFCDLYIDYFSTPLRLFWSIYSKMGDFSGLSLEITRKRQFASNNDSKREPREVVISSLSSLTNSDGFCYDSRLPSFDGVLFDEISYNIYLKKGTDIVFQKEVRVNRNHKPSDALIITDKRRKFHLFGREIIVLKKIRTGIRCSCWNDVLEKIESPSCTSCGGTGYVDGYFSPFITKCFFEGKPNLVEAMNMGGNEENMQQSFVMPDFPSLVSGDIIIDEFGKRYSVSVSQSLGSMSCCFEQRIQAVFLAKSHVAYKIPAIECNKRVIDLLKGL